MIVKNHTSKLVAIAALMLLSFSLSAAEPTYKSQKEKFSYAVGVQMGNSLKQQGIADLDPKAVGQAISDVLSGAKLKLSNEEMQAAIVAFNQEMMKKRQAEGDKNKAAGDKFRAENKKRKGVKELKNGIQYEVLKKGKGAKPKVTDTVTVHYTGTLIDGTVFDSSVKRGVPATFSLKGVIPGWKEILPMMPTGSKWKVVIPPELAYGERGAGAKIGPNATLIFEIELISIKQ
jgi:FKBP-type peptidyl-prolyl cis-trans isomerase FklB